MRSGAVVSATGEAPLRGTPADRCANCQTPLASDQRYCVSCGVRRGKSRFSLESMAAQAALVPASALAPPRKTRRTPPGVTLVSGVATLLLAMGVGVLIGHDSTSPTPQRASAQVITVNGGSASPQTAAGTASQAQGRTNSKTKAKTAKQLGFKPTVVHLSKKTVQAANQAATKVFGQHGNLAPPTVQVGQACTHGAGCQGGKFTGNFFH
jgi:hypothetical protein